MSQKQSDLSLKDIPFCPSNLLEECFSCKNKLFAQFQNFYRFYKVMKTTIPSIDKNILLISFQDVHEKYSHSVLGHGHQLIPLIYIPNTATCLPNTLGKVAYKSLTLTLIQQERGLSMTDLIEAADDEDGDGEAERSDRERKEL